MAQALKSKKQFAGRLIAVHFLADQSPESVLIGQKPRNQPLRHALPACPPSDPVAADSFRLRRVMNLAGKRPAAGFSLVGLVGALAVVAILAAAITPRVIKQVDRTNWVKETADLATLADGLKQQVVRTKSVPSAAGCIALLSEELALSPVQVATNRVGRARAILIDPLLSIGSTTTGSLPYIQGSNGVASAPANVRVLIVSSLSRPLPATVWTPAQPVFTNLWDTPEGAVPSLWSGTWDGRGADLKIQRLDLRPSFSRLILNPIDPTGYGRVSLDGSVPAVVTNIQSRWYVTGTVVGLSDTNNSSSAVTLEAREFLQQDTSYVFENKLWRTQIFDGRYPQSSTSNDPNNYAGAFGAAAGPYLSTYNPNGKNGSTPTVVLSAFYTLMLDYYTWSLAGMVATADSYIAVNQDQGKISNLLDDLDKHE
jgi:hypothetical protein